MSNGLLRGGASMDGEAPYTTEGLVDLLTDPDLPCVYWLLDLQTNSDNPDLPDQLRAVVTDSVQHACLTLVEEGAIARIERTVPEAMAAWPAEFGPITADQMREKMIAILRARRREVWAAEARGDAEWALAAVDWPRAGRLLFGWAPDFNDLPTEAYLATLVAATTWMQARGAAIRRQAEIYIAAHPELTPAQRAHGLDPKGIYSRMQEEARTMHGWAMEELVARQVRDAATSAQGEEPTQ